MRAIAKTNLFLEILGKREDGYHDLNNVFVPLPAIYDEVELRPAETKDFGLQVENYPDLAADRSNLCLKAADAFAAATALHPNVDIVLRKHIPIAAGLGGGSSDAAAVLLLLNEHCGRPLSSGQLVGLASSLGADVPFFLNPTPSLGTGKGDVLSPIELNVKFDLLVLSPGFPLPVAWTFGHRLAAAPEAPSLEAFLEAARGDDLPRLAAVCRNDLEKAVLRKFPILSMIAEQALNDGALSVQVSGSGPSLVCIFAPGNADEPMENLVKAFSGCNFKIWKQLFR